MFRNNQIKAVYDATNKKWYFSAVDVYIALTNAQRKKARDCINALASREQEKNTQSLTFSQQLKFPSEDGKSYFSTAIDIEGILNLVFTVKSDKADQLKNALLKTLSQNTDIAGAFEKLASNIYKNGEKEEIAKKVKSIKNIEITK